MPRHMNERDKLRKFRELDDAFAQALRELDGGASRHEKEEEKEEVVANSPGFEDRLHSLMNEYALTRVNVHEMLSTLIEYRRIS
nr:hypothetical protein [Salinicola sp. S1-1-2]